MKKKGDIFSMRCWELRKLIESDSWKIWEDWNHNMYGFGDGPVGEFIPVENLDMALHRHNVMEAFLKRKEFQKYLYSSQPVSYFFRYIKTLITKIEGQLEKYDTSNGQQLSFFDQIAEPVINEEEKRKLQEEKDFLSEVKELIKTYNSYIGDIYRVRE